MLFPLSSQTSPFHWAKSAAHTTAFAVAGLSAWNSLPDPVHNPLHWNSFLVHAKDIFVCTLLAHPVPSGLCLLMCYINPHIYTGIGLMSYLLTNYKSYITSVVSLSSNIRLWLVDHVTSLLYLTQSWSPRGRARGLEAPRGQPIVSLALVWDTKSSALALASGKMFPVLVLGFEPKNINRLSINSLAILSSRWPVESCAAWVAVHRTG